jgi:hypothetical protein
MARSFLGLLFESKPKESYILIWTKEEAQKLSKWFQNVDSATKYAHKAGSKADTYFGIGLASEALEKYERVPADKVAGLPGLWIDIDYKAPLVHKKEHIPDTEADALWLVEQMPLEPSLLVHSGHGFQAYWQFPKVVNVESGEQRIYLADLSERWQGYCKAVAATRGWDVDSTFDLARVFRIPETYNLKDKEHPVKVDLRYVAEHRYEASQLEAALERKSVAIGAPLVDLSNKRSAKKQLATDAAFKLDPDAEPPANKFKALYANDERFQRSWDHQRNEWRDTSPSSYDCSLATLAYNAGWNDQDIVNLLIAHRRKYDIDLKLRVDYYARTLAEAKFADDVPKKIKTAAKQPAKAVKQTEAKREKRTAAEIKEENEPPADEASDNKESNLAVVSEAFQISISRIVKYLSDPPQYVICLTGGKEIEVKPMVFMSQQVMRTTLAIAVNRKIPKMKPGRWDHLSDCMFAAIDEVQPGEETTHLGSISHYLYKFLRVHYKPDFPEESQHDRAFRGNPAKLAGKCCIEIDSFLRFVTQEFGQKLDKATVSQRLMRLGCVKEKRSLRKGKEVTSRPFWIIPDEFITDHELLFNAEAELLEGEESEERLSVN